MLSRAAVLASESSLTGFEFAGGIPGTVGGAVSMNAGAYGGEIKDVIVSADVLMSDGTVVKLTKDELELSYRNSIVQKEKMIVLSAEFALKKGNKSEILDKMKGMSAHKFPKLCYLFSPYISIKVFTIFRYDHIVLHSFIYPIYLYPQWLWMFASFTFEIPVFASARINVVLYTDFI